MRLKLIKDEKTPVVFIIYNRPKKTEQSFQAIKRYKPKTLYIIADGPKNHEDQQMVTDARKVVEDIDWKCEVIKIYSPINLTCGLRIFSGLNQVFNTCDQAIIIEDDILTSPEFFDFCTTLLHHFEYDKNVMAINGWNGWIDYNSQKHNAFRSKYSAIWGWATWKRAWNKISFEPNYTENELSITLQKYFNNSFREELTTHTYKHRLWRKFNSWDLQWSLAIYMNNSYVLTSSNNLCRNIGFGVDGTHLTNDDFRGQYPLPEQYKGDVITIKDGYTGENEYYDLGMVMMNIVCMYSDAKKLMLLFKNPQLIPADQSKIGWKCQLEPFQYPDLILEMVDIIGKYVDHPQLHVIRKVFRLAKKI